MYSVMSDNKSALISAFEKTATIGGRYTNLYCVNFRPGDIRQERGGYSLVFRADDFVSGRRVAIKTMDPDHISDLYRMDCFAREPEIISGLGNHHRCLRLIEGRKIFDIDLSTETGATFK